MLPRCEKVEFKDCVCEEAEMRSGARHDDAPRNLHSVVYEIGDAQSRENCLLTEV